MAKAQTPSRVAARVTLTVLAIGSVWLLCWYAIDILLLLFAGLLFGVFLRALADTTSDRLGWSSRAGLTAVVFVGTVVFALATWSLFESISGQFDQLAADLPRALSRLKSRVEGYGWGRWLVEQVSEPAEMDWNALVWSNGVLPSTFGTTFSVVSGALVVLFVGIYFAAQPDWYRRGLLRLVPLDKRSRVGEVLEAVSHRLRWWLVGQSLAMLTVGVLTFVGLSILGLDLALALGVLAGALAFVPYLGPVMAFVPAGLIALLSSPAMTVWVGLVYLGIQTVESYVVTPNIQRRAVALPPILTLAAQLVMGALAGTLGLLLATPLTACALPIVQMLYVEDVLGDAPERA